MKTVIIKYDYSHEVKKPLAIVNASERVRKYSSAEAPVKASVKWFDNA